MLVGIGCDIVLIKRLDRWMRKKSLLERYFTRDEIKSLCHDTTYVANKRRYYSLQRLAGFFAAKEAYMKSVENTAIQLKDIVIELQANGSPRLRLERSAKKALIAKNGKHTLLSISHDEEYVVAMVVIGA